MIVLEHELRVRGTDVHVRARAFRESQKPAAWSRLYPPVRRGRWATLVAWFRWRSRRPHPARYGGDWHRFRRDLERWRTRRP